MNQKLYTSITTLLFTFLFIISANAQCLTDGHSNMWEDSWISCNETPNPNPVRGMSHWIEYDFGEPYFLGELTLWNANQTGETDRGFQQMVIDYSMDGTNWIEWGTYTLNQAPGTDGYMGENGPDLAGIKAQYLILTAVSNYGDPNCASLAEVKFEVIPAVTSELNFTVFLEGPYNPVNQLMEVNLTALAPLTQPFSVAPYYYNGTENVSAFPSNAVDWLLLEVREGTPSLSGQRSTRTIDQRAVLLLNNGSIVDVDGNLPRFDLALGIPYHFCIRHRTHLDVFTANAANATPLLAYDLTTSNTQAFGVEQLKLMSDGKAVLYSGDFTQDGVLQTTDYDAWQANPAQLDVYSIMDGNLDGSVQTTDYDLWFPNRAKIGAVEIGY